MSPVSFSAPASTPAPLARATAGLLVIDIQDRLVPAMAPEIATAVVKHSAILIAAATRLGLPIVASEQYPRGLGATVPAIADALAAARAAGAAVHTFEKVEFSSAAAPAFAQLPPASRPRQWILCGMETHVCVYQTARDLARTADVHVVADAVCSRTKANWKLGLELVRAAGAALASTESVVFELLGKAGTDDFKALSKLIK